MHFPPRLILCRSFPEEEIAGTGVTDLMQLGIYTRGLGAVGMLGGKGGVVAAAVVAVVQ